MEEIILKYPLLSVIIILLIAVSVFCIVLLSSSRKWKKTVERTSCKLRSLREYNARWTFKEVKEEYIFQKDFSSKEKYEQYDPDLLFFSVVSAHIEELVTQLSLIKENENLYDVYIAGLRDGTIETPTDTVRQNHIPRKAYYRIEQQLFEKMCLPKPKGFCVKVNLHYQSQAREKVYSYTEVQARIDQHYRIEVERTSTKLQDLSQLNYEIQKHQEVVRQHLEFTKYCKTSTEYKKYLNSDLFLKEAIRDNFALFSQQISNVKKNEAVYKAYLQAYQRLRRTEPSIVYPTGLPETVYYCLESALCEEKKIAVFGNVFDCSISVFYTSPKGRNSKEYHSCYSYHQIDSIFQTGCEAWEKERKYQRTKDYERNKMTNSLRYDVMKRDGFKCVLCGASQKDGAKLHVDHIKPIAKGGKTEMSNLRTLCDRCNSGKRDKYDSQGIN